MPEQSFTLVPGFRFFIAATIGRIMLCLPRLMGGAFVKVPLIRKAVMIIAAMLVHAIILCGGAWAAFVFQPFGHRLWTAVSVGAGLAAVAVKIRRDRRLATNQPDSPGQVHGRSAVRGRPYVRHGELVIAGVLVCWLGLIVWSAISSGGPIPSANSNPEAIRVLTWNILHGTDRGMPWTRNGWSIRKKAIAEVLASTKPDILCVQEAREEQGRYLAGLLPGHRRIGAGRDDGRLAGEHCSILFDRTRFEELDSGTFWLEEPTDRPPAGFRLGPKRICTWARLSDRRSGRALRVYNTHQYLTEQARVRAVVLILKRIDLGDPSDAVVITGDFNAPPDTQNRRLLEAVGLASSAHFAQMSDRSATYQFYGIRLRPLDEILVNRRWRVENHRVIDAKPENTFPSDHFAVMADLMFEE